MQRPYTEKKCTIYLYQSFTFGLEQSPKWWNMMEQYNPIRKMVAHDFLEFFFWGVDHYNLDPNPAVSENGVNLNWPSNDRRNDHSLWESISFFFPLLHFQRNHHHHHPPPSPTFWGSSTCWATSHPSVCRAASRSFPLRNAQGGPYHWFHCWFKQQK